MSVIKFEEINVDDIKFEIDPENTSSVNILYKYPGKSEYEKGLRVQTKKVKIPFGVGDNIGYLKQKKLTTPPAYNITISTKNNDQMVDILKEIQETVFDFIQENSVTFFKEKHERGTIKALFNKTLKESSNPKYPEYTFSTKIYHNVEDDSLSCKVVYPDGEKAVLTVGNRNTVFPKMSEAIMLLQLNSIYFMNNKFGTTWRANRARVFKSLQQEIDFLPVSDDEGSNAANDDVGNFLPGDDEPVVETKKPAVSNGVTPRRVRKN